MKSIVSKLFTILALVAVSNLLGCKNNSSTTHETEDTKTESSEATMTEVVSGTFYYGQLDPSPMEASKYNVQLLELSIDEKGIASGYFYNQPYGSDGNRGSFKGQSMDGKTVNAERSYMAEGELYKDPVSYTLKDASIGLGFNDNDGKEASLPKLDQATYEGYLNTFKTQQLSASINTTDRSRVSQLAFLKENLSAEEIANLKFMEVMCDLNNDPSNFEYLIYIMDPNFCGTGGCNLIVSNDKGYEFANISVSRPPIYIPRSTIEQTQAQKGQWKDLYVYSKGMKRLTYKDGAYTSNASMGEAIGDAQLIGFPEQYQLVMDYME